MENNLEVLKTLKIELPYDPTIPTCAYVAKRIENRVSKRYLHTNVHSSTIHNRQEVEATQVSINRCSRLTISSQLSPGNTENPIQDKSNR